MSTITDPDLTKNPAPPVVPRLRRWLAPLFFLAGVGLLPWTVYLIVTLPGRHLQTGYFDLAWGGFDVALAALLVATGVGLVCRKLWVQSTATAAATMLGNLRWREHSAQITAVLGVFANTGPGDGDLV